MNARCVQISKTIILGYPEVNDDIFPDYMANVGDETM